MNDSVERHDHRLEVAGGVATITLERPAAYNAVTRKLVRSLLATLQAAGRDPAVRAMVVTGSGKGFCAGQALDDPDTLGADGRTDFRAAIVEGFNPLISALLTVEKPVIAAVNGVAAGAGLGLALACDFRIAADTATFTTAFAKIGLVPDSGISFLLPRLIGYARALELCICSTKIDAATAMTLGLVTEIVPREKTLARAQEFAAELAGGPAALGLIKRELVRNGLGDVSDALAYEAEIQGIAGETADALEGIAAFRAKRKPVFSGR